MLSAWVKAPFEVDLRDLPVPEVGPDQVLVRVEACGVCGTDLHYARTFAKEWMPLGHEAVGVVEKVGPGVSEDWLGKKVLALNYTACGQCEACLNGHWEHCLNMPTYMEEERGWQAGMSEYLLLRADMVYEYEGLSPVHAAFVEPLSVALDLVTVADIPLRGDVAVFGPGPIGLAAVRLCKLKGARRVFLTVPSRKTARHRKRAEVGEKMGADEIIFADEEDPAEKVLSICPKGLDRILVTAPPKTIPQAIKMCRFGGNVSYIGIEFGPGAVVPIDLNELHFRKAQLRASHAIPDVRFPLCFDLMRSKAVDPELLVTHVFPLRDAAKALEVANSQDEPVIKVVVDCS
ncbi:MAG: zinc-dependent alcohol dehydrogenase [Anaerolineae bacterium]